jgi:Putative peptidoglycan binding domain
MNYTDLRFGDRLPTVGVLQCLLNRTGASLVTDGHFGKKTLTAVKAFQRQHGLAHDGIVGENTWRRLTTGLRLPILDSVDVWDPTFLREDARYIKKTGATPVMIGGACNGVEQVVSELSGAGSSVFLLRFHGHGAPGVASVAAGHGELDPRSRQGSDILMNPRINAILARLRSIFGPYGSVQFIECETGRGSQGRRLLTQLATDLRVPVTGAVNDQPFGKTWSFRLDGPTTTVCPGGVSLADWCRALPAFVGVSVA